MLCIMNLFSKCSSLFVLLAFIGCSKAQPDRPEAATPPQPGPMIPEIVIPGQPGAQGDAEKNRFTTPSTTIRMIKRYTAQRIQFKQRCSYLVYYCLSAYNTGKLCARTVYYAYYTFRTYCLMDFVNCMERAEVWQVSYMGECKNIRLFSDYLLYYYDDDYFLDHHYIMEDHK